MSSSFCLGVSQVFEITACNGGTEGPERHATKSDYHLSGVVNQLQFHVFTRAVSTNLKILSHCLYHNFLNVQNHQYNYKLYPNLFI